MDATLKDGTLLVSDSGNRYKVIRFLGAGGQGEVYEIERNSKRFALKWYFPKMATSAQRAILKRLITKGAPNETFLWPEDMLYENTGGALGYVMRLRPHEYKGIVDIMLRKAEISFESMCKAAFKLTYGYRTLHKLGYSYRDISFGNVFINPSNGNVLICDNDNVAASGDDNSPVYGTPRFMAPEIVVGTARPSRNTDIYSLSVLLFYMFMLHHPLEGKREADIHALDIFAMTKLFGKNPLFIFDPEDESNRPVKGYQDNAILYWDIYPKSLKDKFIAAFTVGLLQPNRRITENQWLDTLSNMLSQITRCPKCGAETFIDTGKCWACKLNITSPPVITVDKCRIALTSDTVLYSHYINEDYDIDTIVGRITHKPDDPSRIGIRNETNSIWTYIKADGTELPIAPGKSAAVVNGAKLKFGQMTGEIKA